MRGLHKTIRFPNNMGSYTCNAVLPEHLENHIEYNSTNRFGQSLFVDDVCVYHSCYHNDKEIEKMLEMSKSLGMREHSTPYR